MRYQLSWPAIKVCAVGLLHAGGGIPCRPHPRRLYTTCFSDPARQRRVLRLIIAYDCELGHECDQFASEDKNDRV